MTRRAGPPGRTGSTRRTNASAAGSGALRCAARRLGSGSPPPARAARERPEDHRPCSASIGACPLSRPPGVSTTVRCRRRDVRQPLRCRRLLRSRPGPPGHARLPPVAHLNNAGAALPPESWSRRSSATSGRRRRRRLRGSRGRGSGPRASRLRRHGAPDRVPGPTRSRSRRAPPGPGTSPSTRSPRPRRRRAHRRVRVQQQRARLPAGVRRRGTGFEVCRATTTGRSTWPPGAADPGELGPAAALVALTHVPTSSGTVQPAAEVGRPTRPPASRTCWTRASRSASCRRRRGDRLRPALGHGPQVPPRPSRAPASSTSSIADPGAARTTLRRPARRRLGGRGPLRAPRRRPPVRGVGVERRHPARARRRRRLRPRMGHARDRRPGHRRSRRCRGGLADAAGGRRSTTGRPHLSGIVTFSVTGVAASDVVARTATQPASTPASRGPGSARLDLGASRSRRRGPGVRPLLQRRGGPRRADPHPRPFRTRSVGCGWAGISHEREPDYRRRDDRTGLRCRADRLRRERAAGDDSVPTGGNAAQAAAVFGAHNEPPVEMDSGGAG